MTLIRHEAANLIGGVSQQPPAARFASQAEEQINGYCSEIDGLTKRPPTQHLARLLSGSTSGRFMHVIFRDATERYALVAGNGSLQAFELDGTEVPIHAPGGGAPDLSYLDATDPAGSYRALTVADFTFMVNTKKKVEMDSTLSRDFNWLHSSSSKGYVFIRQPALKTRYRIYFSVGNGGGFPTGEWYVQHITSATTVEDSGSIAQSLADLINSGTNFIPTDGGPGVAIPGITATVGATSGKPDSSVIEVNVTHTGGSSIAEFRGLRHHDGLGGTAMVTFYRTVTRYDSLPLVCRDGEVFEVTGDANLNQDNYWIEFDDNNENIPFGEGTWREAIKPQIKYQFDDATMPHQLVRKQDDASGTITGTPNAKYFEWGPVAWSDREVGDETTNPEPSFVSTSDQDRFVDGIFFHKNRLGLLSGEAVVLSAAGSFFNFWRTTVVQLLDGDPIDIQASHTNVALMRNAVGFNERLLTFSDRTQFVLDGEPILTPKTAAITSVTEFDSSTVAVPRATGRGVYFAYERGDFSGLRELFQLGDSALFDAADVSAHVPQYLKGCITQIAASTLVDLVAVVTDGAPDTVYAYKYSWSGAEKIQSAWGKWTFGTDTEVRAVEFIEDELIILIQRAEGLFLEKIQLGDDLTDVSAPYVTHLDRRVTESDSGVRTTYDADLDLSTVELPYQTDSAETYRLVERYTATHVGGQVHPVVQVGADFVKVRGDVVGVPMWIGVDYRFEYEFSPPVLRTRRGTSTSPVSSGRQQLRYGNLEYADSRYFRAEITPSGGRAPRTVEFVPPQVGEDATRVNGMQLPSGVFRFAVMANAREVGIKLINDSPFPCKLVSIEWESNYAARTRPPR